MTELAKPASMPPSPVLPHEGGGGADGARDAPLVRVRHLTRVFDVSKPWLNRMIERLPKARLTAVSDVSFTAEAGRITALIGPNGAGKTTTFNMVAGALSPTSGTVSFEGRAITSDVSFDIPARTIYALVGESGSGKSTIGKILVGLIPPSSGAVEIGGVDLHRSTDVAAIDRTRAAIQMIFQDPYASLNPRWRVRDIIAEPVRARGGATDGLAERLLEQVGLSAADAAKFPHEFSGGQRQRIAVARAMDDPIFFLTHVDMPHKTMKGVIEKSKSKPLRA